MSKRPRLSLNFNELNNGAGLQDTIMDTVKILEEHTPPAAAEPRSYKRIPYQKIISSPLNDYPIDGLDELENLLLKYGLLEPFSVHYDEEHDLYILESGDRRFHALGNLFNLYENTDEPPAGAETELYRNNLHGLYVNGIYCMIENGPCDDDSVKARIIIHNETSRPFDIMRTASKINELSGIYSRQNAALPKDQRVNVNKKIESDLKGRYTVRQLIRYKNFDKLIDELKNAVIDHNISVSEISTYHTLSPDEQSVLAEYIKQYHVPGSKIELPSREELQQIVSSSLKENSQAPVPSAEPEPKEISEILPEDSSAVSDSESLPEQPQQDEPQPELQPQQPFEQSDKDMDALKADAVKRIQETKGRKDSKIIDAAHSIGKKAQQLEKAIFSYIADESEMNLNLENLVKELDSAVLALTSIKSFLENQDI